MRHRFLTTGILFVLCFAPFFAHGQDSTMLPKYPPKARFWDKVYVGGNLGFQFGTVTFAEVSPLVGYNFTEKLSGGIGLTYQYYSYKDPSYQLTTNVYGARAFGRYFFTDYLFGHVEFEHLNLDAFDFYPARRRVDVESFFAGGGYFQRIAGNSGLYVMLLYNFTETLYTPYTNPVIRIGINIGL